MDTPFRLWAAVMLKVRQQTMVKRSMRSDRFMADVELINIGGNALLGKFSKKNPRIDFFH